MNNFLITFIFIFTLIIVDSIAGEEKNHETLNLTQTKMVGGTDVYSYNQANFVVNILIDDSERCGGAIISSNRVLTAAHCLYEKNNVAVQCGYISLLNPPPEAILISVHHENFTIHHSYDPVSLQNDIAVINLPDELKFESIQIQSIPLFTQSDATTTSLSSGTSMLSGWGITSDSGTESNDHLQYVIQSLISYQSCQEKYPEVTELNLCTISDDDTMKGGCKGDSGGPLVANVNGVIKLIGILSFASQYACESMDPRGYTNIVLYSDWLCQYCDVCTQ